MADSSTSSQEEQQYLETHHADRTPDFVDGAVMPRPMPDSLHSEVQVELVHLFRNRRDQYSLHVRPEIRLKVAEGKYRVADLAVFYPDKPVQPVPEFLPVVVVEIASIEDLPAEIHVRATEYLEMGVSQVWVVDPHARAMFVYGDGMRTVVEGFQVPQFDLDIKLDDLLPRPPEEPVK